MKIDLELGIYEHYKGNLYLVQEIARHSETLEPYVMYRQLYGDYALWVRPLTLFQEDVIVDGKQVPRFKFVRKTQLPEIESR
jgi:hypothetical protein